MGKKKNRCAISSCGLVIDNQYTFCYMHRMCSLKTQIQKELLKNFFCDRCGQVTQAKFYTHCKWCGGITEEVANH